MRYRKLDSTGDYVIGRRDEMYEGTEAVAQAVKTRLLLLLGEWWETPSDGTPLFEKVLGQRLKASDSPDEIAFANRDAGNGYRFSDEEQQLLRRKWGKFLMNFSDVILFNDAFFTADPDELEQLAKDIHIKIKRR